MNQKANYRNLSLHLMLIPGIIVTILFTYIPLLGSVMAFQDYNPIVGFRASEWVGWDNFIFLHHVPGMYSMLWNTVYISLLKIIGLIVVPVLFALLLNEVIHSKVKKTIQSMIYLPNFLSWVIISGILIDILSPSSGIVNMYLGLIGISPIFFLGDTTWFPITMVLSDIWKSFGFGTVIYLAALTSINPSLYESAVIDGANRWKQTIYITLPGIKPIIILMTVLGLGNILNAGFEQIYNLLSPSVYSTGDIIDTFIFRLGIEQAQFSEATAVGLFKSVISLIFVSLSYYLASRFANYRIF
jgi:putative aldouronate transport system permease protein